MGRRRGRGGTGGMKQASSQGVRRTDSPALSPCLPVSNQGPTAEKPGERERASEQNGRDEDRQIARSCRAQGAGWCFDFEAFKKQYLATQCALTLKTPVPVPELH
ncbi:unnamed protein product [Symbiodinium sp. CCMP2592]|nr:unnamed protein product [Symbiodinium sp. CCMP2592]